MTNQEIEAVLKKYKCRATAIRIKALSLLVNHGKAFSISEIEEHLREADRVTIYRTFNSFVELSLVSKVFNNKGVTCFFYNGSEHKEKCVHPHLHCTSCNRIVCLPEYPESYLKTLDQYKADHIPVLMEGVCENCL
ncbi:MAG: transcriptional repressor [Roseivirga sp.]|jgi:Fur family ferric uptake transcriptional regulator|uniref:Fur family transcriptional regulator n=1 Tax=Roseivirga sp. TaxID=1964215 RepID=UPI001B0D4E8C|nr:transcriptional repressor [Roseivirga sp.]MBO6493995.1 transcriptional repressor [Roseivirga sp.]